MKSFIQRYWALIIMLLVVVIALIGAVNPPWYSTYQMLLWAGAVILTVIFWSMRKKDED